MNDSCSSIRIDPSRIFVYYDQEGERQLLMQWRGGIIERIPRDHIQVMPHGIDRNTHYLDERINSIKNILHYERPDYIFLYDDRPFLAVEITTHGYTGDNGLQRFARMYFCAKESVPSIYCTPLARTRYDELAVSRRPASRRNVSSRLTEEFVRLHDTCGVPVFIIPLEIDEVGLPAVENIPTCLFPVVEHIIQHHVDRQLESCPVVQSYMSLTRTHAMNSNIRESEIRIDGVLADRIGGITLNPSEFISLIGRDYFFKGKRDKLLALRALEISECSTIEIRTAESSINVSDDLEQHMRRIIEHDYANCAFNILYSGYQWRPDPISGIVANERSRIGTENCLVLIWPRIFYEDTGPRRSLLSEIGTMRRGEDCRLSQLLIERMQRKDESGSFIVGFSRSENQFGFWNDDCKQAKIFGELCDIIILNDAAIIKRRDFT